MTLFNEIPSVDLAKFTQGTAQNKFEFVSELGRALEEIGFVAVKNHGLSDSLSNKLYQEIINFFELPSEVKSKYEIEGLFGQRGYTGKGKEHAKGSNVGDLKEFYHIGQEISDSEFGGNIWPEELPEFKKITVEAFKILEETGIKLLQAIALHLQLDEHYFDDKVRGGDSILRPIHYFPILNPDQVPEGAVRAGAHGDINFITLLMGASAEGLEILRKDGKWIGVTALPDQIVVNVSDMLARLTNDKLSSTIHRVVNPSKEKMGLPRYSIPFFMHPKGETSLACLPSCVSDENPKKYEDILAKDFLKQRLEEIGLKK